MIRFLSPVSAHLSYVMTTTESIDGMDPSVE